MGIEASSDAAIALEFFDDGAEDLQCFGSSFWDGDRAPTAKVLQNAYLTPQ
jgi:hypothetical protein